MNVAPPDAACFVAPALSVTPFTTRKHLPKSNSAATRRHNSAHPVMCFQSNETPTEPVAAPQVTPAKPSHNSETPCLSVDPKKAQTCLSENMRGFVKTRGSLNPGEESVFWFAGSIFDLRDGHRSRHLFDFEGYNIARMVPIEGGWRMLSREVGLYKEPETGAILDVWRNVDTGKRVDVVHVWNDPVNQDFSENGPYGKFKVPVTIQGEDVYWNTEFFMKYASPLTREEYPDHANSDTYQSAEMFQFFTTEGELRAEKPTANCSVSWVRFGQWLPWMEMGDRAGKLVYHCRGRRLTNGWSDLSGEVRKYVRERYPEYQTAPTEYSRPNETSWTYMKKLLERKGAPRADGTVAREEPESRTELEGGVDGEKIVQMTRAELAGFDGSDLDRPIYLAVAGKVFDVSKGRRHYQKGETYNCLTGRDASSAFISGDLSESGVREEKELGTLREEEQETLQKWVEFFAKSYRQVGILVD